MQYIDGKIGAFSGNDWKPAYQLEAGVRQDMTDKISVFGEYRFSQSAAASFDNTWSPRISISPITACWRASATE